MGWELHSHAQQEGKENYFQSSTYRAINHNQAWTDDTVWAFFTPSPKQLRQCNLSILQSGYYKIIKNLSLYEDIKFTIMEFIHGALNQIDIARTNYLRLILGKKKPETFPDMLGFKEYVKKESENWQANNRHGHDISSCYEKENVAPSQKKQCIRSPSVRT